MKVIKVKNLDKFVPHVLSEHQKVQQFFGCCICEIRIIHLLIEWWHARRNGSFMKIINDRLNGLTMKNYPSTSHKAKLNQQKNMVIVFWNLTRAWNLLYLDKLHIQLSRMLANSASWKCSATCSQDDTTEAQRIEIRDFTTSAVFPDLSPSYYRLFGHLEKF